MLRLPAVGLSDERAQRLPERLADCSFAAVARVCDDAIRTMALDDREIVCDNDVLAALAPLARRGVHAGA